MSSWPELRAHWRAERERRRWDHPHPSRQTSRNAAIVRMYRDGLSCRRIAEIYGVSNMRVRQIIAAARSD